MPVPRLSLLFVEDDTDALEQFRPLMPTSLGGIALDWDFDSDFSVARERLESRRYDIVVTDIYRDRVDGQRKGISPADEKAADIIETIRRLRFTPVIAFTDGSQPQRFQESVFVRILDKSDPQAADNIVKLIEEFITMKAPLIARALHDELDRTSGSYLWTFLERNWNRPEASALRDPAILERVMRRRAAIQLSRLDSTQAVAAELENIKGAEFYIWPSIAGPIYRLGEIVRRTADGTFCVLLTPHCHLTVQREATAPRAEFVLIVRTVPATTIFDRYPCEGSTPAKKLESLAKYLRSPAQVKKGLDGRYWFLPGFIDLPDLYCDFLQIESVPFAELGTEFERVAVLDTPFAEALQACFTRFYSAVGLSNLNPADFGRYTEAIPPMVGTNEAAR